MKLKSVAEMVQERKFSPPTVYIFEMISSLKAFCLMLARKISTPFASVINQRAYQRRVRKGVSRFFIKGVIIYPYTHFDVYIHF